MYNDTDFANTYIISQLNISLENSINHSQVMIKYIEKQTNYQSDKVPITFMLRTFTHRINLEKKRSKIQ